jgi:hypothetical protein
LAEAIIAIRGYLDRVAPWRLDGLCREPDYPTEMFFPERGAVRLAEEARRVCSRCLVQRECRSYAVQHSDQDLIGVWAGLSGRERRAARRRQSAA